MIADELHRALHHRRSRERSTRSARHGFIRVLARIAREAAWAPLAVLVLNAFFVRLYADLYWLLHLLGGAALAFFFFRAIRIAGAYLGTLRRVTHYALALTLTCTAGLLWEIGEFTIDQLLLTQLQEDLAETMVDLILDMTGASVTLIVMAWVQNLMLRKR